VDRLSTWIYRRSRGGEWPRWFDITRALPGEHVIRVEREAASSIILAVDLVELRDDHCRPKRNADRYINSYNLGDEEAQIVQKLL
jgi:hypothetical protein